MNSEGRVPPFVELILDVLQILVIFLFICPDRAGVRWHPSNLIEARKPANIVMFTLLLSLHRDVENGLKECPIAFLRDNLFYSQDVYIRFHR